MGILQTATRSLFSCFLLIGMLASTHSVEAQIFDPVAQVCGTPGNTCINGMASINVRTTVECPFIDFGEEITTLDFVSAGFPFVQIGSGASLEAEDIPRCSMTLIVGDLLVKLGGKLNVDKKNNNTPGTVKVIASDTIRVDKGGRITAIGGKQTEAHPTVDLMAGGDISIAGIVEARGTSAIGNGGRILMESEFGMVTIEGTAKVKATSTDPGGTLIRIRACLGIEIFGTVDATSKKREAILELFSREGILIDGGKVIADIKIGELEPGDLHTMTIQARGDIIVRDRQALISASTKTTNKKGGTINILSTEGAFLCEDGDIKADSRSGGSDGGFIEIQALNNVLYDCDISALGSNANNGVGGVVSLQSFQQDVLGSGNIDVSARSQGTIILQACENPLTGGGSFSTFPSATGGICVDSPLTIPPCIPTGNNPDVSIEKFDSPDPVPAGGFITYLLAVSNESNLDAENVVVTDTLPSETTFDSCSVSQGSCSHSNGVVTADLGTLGPSGFATVSIVVVAPTGSDCGPGLLNRAVVAADDDSNPNNNEATATTECIPPPNPPDVKIEKSDNPDPVPAGGLLAYNLLVQNIGGQTATNVVATDTLPAGVSFFSCTPSQGNDCTESGGVVTANLGSLAPSGMATVTIIVFAPTGTQCTNGLLNRAVVAADSDSNPNNNDDEETTDCIPPPDQPDVKVTKTDSKDPVDAGEFFTYNLLVQNIGGETATNVVATDTLPTGVIFDSCIPSQGNDCTESGGVVTANLGSLAPGAIATVSIIVQAPTGSACTDGLLNRAVVAADNDSNPNNNLDTETTDCTPPPSPPDVTIQKTDNPDPVTEGGLLSYSLAIQNTGGQTATNVMVVDTLPTGVTFSSCNATQGSCSESGGIVTADLGTLGGGAQATVTIVVIAPTGSACTNGLLNRAVVSADNDSNPNNNEAEEPTACGTPPDPPDVTIEKTDNPDPVPAGGFLTYSLIVRNEGGSPATNVVAVDTLPTATSFVSCTPSQGNDCTENNGLVTANLGTLAGGASATVTIVVIAPSGSECGPGLLNRALVGADNDSNPNNNTDEETTDCVPGPPPPCIDIEKKVNNKDADTCPGLTVKPGKKLIYKYFVKNCGDVDLLDITVTDDILGDVGTVDLLKPNKRKVFMLMTFAPSDPSGGTGDDDDDDDDTGDDDDDDDGTGDDDDDDDGTGDDDDDGDGTGDDDDDDDGDERIKNIATAIGLPATGGNLVSDEDPACVTVDFPDSPGAGDDDDDDDDDGTGDDDDDDDTN